MEQEGIWKSLKGFRGNDRVLLVSTVVKFKQFMKVTKASKARLVQVAFNLT
jgi:hypothetical protein